MDVLTNSIADKLVLGSYEVHVIRLGFISLYGLYWNPRDGENSVIS